MAPIILHAPGSVYDCEIEPKGAEIVIERRALVRLCDLDQI
jgi:hypothetical protein